MDWIQLIGAVGIGAIVTKLLDVFWLQRLLQRNEREKWLREQRMRVYSDLSKYLISGALRSQIPERDFLKLAGDLRLLSNNKKLIALIDDYIPDVRETRQRIDHFINNGTSTIEERAEMRCKEDSRIQKKSREIVDALRSDLLNT